MSISLAHKSILLAALATTTINCTTQKLSLDVPEIAISNTTPAGTYIRGDRTISAAKPVYKANGTVTATVSVAATAGSTTTSSGSCLIARYANETECNNEGVSDYVANDCPAPPTGWSSSKYCLTAEGSSKKHCYARPGSAVDYCIGAPVFAATSGAQGVLKLSTGTHTMPSPSAFAAGKTAAHWINYACIDGCGNATYDPGSRSPDLAATEFSGDGRPDLLGRDTGTGYLKVYSANGIGGIALASGANVKASWPASSIIVSAGDFNGDFISDVLELTSSGDLRLWAGTGGGSLAGTYSTVTTGLSLSTLFGVGDFDRDGFNDLMGVTTTNDVYLYTGDGAGGIAASYWLLNSWTYTNVPVGDFDSDGKPDMMALNFPSAGDLASCKGDGTVGGFYYAGACVYTGYDGWGGMNTMVGGIDISGDGLPDLLARTTTGYLLLYPGNGAGTIAGGASIFGSGWNVIGSLTSVY
jgi:hypothetical protein